MKTIIREDESRALKNAIRRGKRLDQWGRSKKKTARHEAIAAQKGRWFRVTRRNMAQIDWEKVTRSAARVLWYSAKNGESSALGESAEDIAQDVFLWLQEACAARRSVQTYGASHAQGIACKRAGWRALNVMRRAATDRDKQDKVARERGLWACVNAEALRQEKVAAILATLPEKTVRWAMMPRSTFMAKGHGSRGEWESNRRTVAKALTEGGWEVI